MNKALVLKCVQADMTTRNGFLWPTSGPVEAPDWNSINDCGNGLHGWLWGEGDPDACVWHRSPAARWLVVEVNAADVVDLDGKVKFPRGVVVFCGSRDEAISYMVANGGDRYAIIHRKVTRVDGHNIAVTGAYGTVSVGENGMAIAGRFGEASAGENGKASAKGEGVATVGVNGKAYVGNYGKASAGDYGEARAGNYGTASAGCCGVATAGVYGKVSVGPRGRAFVGHMGIASADEWGTIIIQWFDGERMRIVIGYVGENGILPNVMYRVQDGRIVPAAESDRS